MRGIGVGVGALALVAIVGAGCGGGGKGGGTAPTHTLTLNGGAGSTGAGGDGGLFDVESDGGAEVRVTTSGAVNTDVTLPTQRPYLGSNPQDVTSDTTLAVGTTGFHLTAGSRTVSNDAGVVTGIRIRPGVTLTIAPNWDLDGNGTRDAAELNLSDGLIVEGTIKLAVRDAASAGDGAGTDTSSLWIAGSYDHGSGVGGIYVAAGGKIDASGADNAAGAGANAGFVRLVGDSAILGGTITTKGGAGTTGAGNGGLIAVIANEGYVVNTGAVVADGGAASAGVGGSAGTVELTSSSGYGFVITKGLVSSVGGDGSAGGGQGERFYIYTDYGATVLDGTIRTYGGAATSDGTGGGGGYVEVDGWGTIRWAGQVDLHGGAGAGSGDGGSAGYVDVVNYDDYPWGGGSYQPDSAGIYFGASVNARGGDGANGGAGNYFYLYNSTSARGVDGSPIQLVGYPEIDLSGGDGATFGGAAGGNAGTDGYLACYSGSSSNNESYGCPVVNAAAFVMRGGAGTSQWGGAGGRLHLETDQNVYPPFDYGVTNGGRIDAAGGRGGTSGGAGGFVAFYGMSFVRSSAPVLVTGGAGGTDVGGGGGEIDLYSSGVVASTGPLELNGGASDASDAGMGGSLYSFATSTVSLTGGIAANGGSSTSGAGGDGGYVWVIGQDAASTVGSVSVAAGTGATGTPAAGAVWIDGMQVAGP